MAKTTTKPKKLGPKEKLAAALNMAAKELGVTIAPPSTVVIPTGPPPNKRLETREDYEFVRNNLRKLIDIGNNALEALMEVAEEDGHPRAYEVVGQLIKALTETTKELINCQREMREIEARDREFGDFLPQDSSSQLLNKSSFTSSQILDMIKGIPEGNK